jgi:transaldolase / glucose-6-phosphate isomerase
VIWKNDTSQVYGTKFAGLDKAMQLNEVVNEFLRLTAPQDYIALNAYLPRNVHTLAKLQKVRAKLAAKTGRPVTLGFGPRFLHSTGQLQKGGPHRVLILQITADAPYELPIPNFGLSFNVLERSQAIGDLDALLARGQRAIRIHLAGAKLEDLFK